MAVSCWNGSKWLKMAKTKIAENGWKWLEIAESCGNQLEGLKKLDMAKMAGYCWKCPDITGMAGHGYKWLDMAVSGWNGYKWL